MRAGRRSMRRGDGGEEAQHTAGERGRRSMRRGDGDAGRRSIRRGEAEEIAMPQR
jgi:hypothetical protein